MTGKRWNYIIGAGASPMPIEHISAVTFAVRDMARAVAFYEKCGFAVVFGGRDAEFTTLQEGEAFVNLIDHPNRSPIWWGRVIVRVSSADEQYTRMRAAGLEPEARPKDAAWGERYFHITDPDGHELSFAEQL